MLPVFGVNKLAENYQGKLGEINAHKERLQGKNIDELKRILANISVFEEKAAAKQLIQEMEG